MRVLAQALDQRRGGTGGRACVSTEQIAGTTNGADQRTLARYVDLLAQTPHVYIDEVGTRIGRRPTQ
ncbi:hypothetical protein P3T40_000216 [Paraburkholderia sp. EB58]